MTSKIVYKQALISAQEKAAVDVDKPIRFVASTESVDRYGDVVRADGWELANFKKNPVVLFSHNHAAPVGTGRAWVENRQLMSDIELAEEGTSAFVDSVRALVRQRVIRAVSVGFMPLETKYIRDEENDRVVGYEFTKQDLLEISLVAVPANQEAIAVARSLGIVDESVLRTLFAPATRGTSVQRATVEMLKLGPRKAA